MNDVEKVLEQFLEIESERDFFNTLLVNDVKVWHYIRKAIHDMIVEKKCGIVNPNSLKKKYEKERGFVNWIDTNILKNQFRVSRKDVLIINHERRMKEGEYYRCIYTDEWLKKFNASYYVFEHAYSGLIHFKPVLTKNLRYIDKQKYNKIFKKEYNDKDFGREIAKVTRCITDMIENDFKLKLTGQDVKRINQLLRGTVNGREICREYWHYILKKIQPKVIIYVVGYFLDNMVLAELGKELGIPTIEITHGHIGRGHVAYNLLRKEQLIGFADYLFVPGQHEVDSMRVPIPVENIFVVGSPEIEKKRDYYEKVIATKKKKKKIITFISSGEAEIADCALELSRKLDENKYKIYFKLHPSEYTTWENKYSRLKDAKVHVVDDSEHDIYYYLAVSDYVIGIASGAMFEATFFDCLILILKRARYHEAAELVSTQNAIYIDTMDEAIEIIKSVVAEKRKSDYFYCENSVRKIQKAINEIGGLHNECGCGDSGKISIW